MDPAMLPPQGKRNEVHLVQCKNGHHMSIDCWCEPVAIYWRTNPHGVLCLVVEHNDDTLRNHGYVLQERDENPDWLDRALRGINPPKETLP